MKREEHREEGLKALDQCEYMVLAMTDLAGEPYCVPLNAVRVGEAIYFHCARAGEKLDCLRAHPSVCLTAVGEQHVIQAEYTTHFTSAVVRGRAVEVTDPSEIRQGLRAICDKYTPDCPGRVEEVIGRTVIIHSQADDFRTQPAGNSGDKIACGTILPSA